jgi:hypothetical protein
MGRVVAAPDVATGFGVHGFGMSDVIVATVAEPTIAPPERWYDYGVAPLFNYVPRGGSLSLLWEVYEAGVRSGNVEYTVAISVERQRSGAGRVAAAILGAAAGVVGVDRRDDRVTLTFERSVAERPVIVDAVTIGLGETPPGEYRVSLEITDTASGRKTSRAYALTIGQ